MQLPFPRRRMTLAQQEELWFYIFMSPWIIGLIFLFGGPILGSLGLSFTNWTGVNVESLEFIGLENYKALWDDKLFWISMERTVYYAVGSVLFGTFFALLIAILMNQKMPGVTLFRTIFYLPSITQGVAIAIMWIWIFNPTVGLLNYFLSIIGVIARPSDGPGWLTSQDWAMPALILMSLWQVGASMIILLAGLQGVPQSLYDAVKIDGANKWHEFRHVTLPMVSPALFFVIVIGTVNSFQIFTNVRVMTEGGPGTSTYVYVYHLYLISFRYFRMGVGSSMAWILLIIVGLLVWLQFKIGERTVHYEGS